MIVQNKTFYWKVRIMTQMHLRLHNMTFQFSPATCDQLGKCLNPFFSNQAILFDFLIQLSANPATRVRHVKFLNLYFCPHRRFFSCLKLASPCLVPTHPPIPHSTTQIHLHLYNMTFQFNFVPVQPNLEII